MPRTAKLVYLIPLLVCSALAAVVTFNTNPIIGLINAAGVVFWANEIYRAFRPADDTKNQAAHDVL